MSFDQTIVCVGYGDPTVSAVVVLCTVVFGWLGRRMGRLVAGRSPTIMTVLACLAIPGVILLMASPVLVVLIVEVTVAVSSPGLFICFAFVRPLLYLPAMAGIGSLLVVTLVRRRESRPSS